MNSPGRKPRFRILELNHLMRQSMWIETSLMESLILREPLYQVKIGVARILQTRHNAFDRPSNERPQSHMVPDASKLDAKTQSLSMLRKHAW